MRWKTASQMKNAAEGQNTRSARIFARSKRLIPFITGGGFGGCTVNLVQKGSEGEMAGRVKAAYMKQFGMDCAVYNIRPGEGAGTVK